MTPADETGTELEAALEAQQSLLEDSLAVAFDAYDEALELRVKSPVVFFVDCEDEIGGQIVRSWLGAAAVDDAIAEQRSEDGNTTAVFAHAFPLAECRVEVPQVFPYLAGAFERELPEDGFLAIAVANGGASALTVPFASRPDGDDDD